MATNFEVSREQKRQLFTLLKIKKDNQDIPIKGIDDAVLALTAEMQQEDVAWVEKKLDYKC